ncbi:MAG: insulinase family protein [Ignavibacteriales bacterium]|nr:insulinase family protein [Ignavibacteriales bacterium]
MKTTIFLLTIFLFMSTALSSSMRIVEMRSEKSPIITFRIQFRTGSINDVKGKEGINAFTAYLIAQGGTQELTYKQVIDKLYPWATQIDVVADKEVTTFIGETHRDHLDNFYKIFSDLILHPRFDVEDYNRLKEDGMNYLKTTLRGTNDEELGKQAMQGMLYENHPYGWTNVGTVQGITATTLEDIKVFYKTNYTQANLTIGIAGGYSKGLLERMKKDFASLPEGKNNVVELPKANPINDLEVTIVDKQSIATAISVGFPVSVTRADKDFYALMVANSYFGEHRTFNGVLMNKIRGERGINYGDYSYAENFIQDGGTRFMLPCVPRRQQFFSIWIRPTKPEDAHFSLREAIRELKKLCENGLTKEQFETTRDFLMNYSKLWVQTQNRRLGFELDSKFYNTEFFVDRLEKELKSMTVKDVNDVIKKHLQFKNAKVAIVAGNANELKEKILTNAESPIKYASKVPDAILEEDKDIVNHLLNINKGAIKIVPVNALFEK